jgi:hypothetical protein
MVLDKSNAMSSLVLGMRSDKGEQIFRRKVEGFEILLDS